MESTSAITTDINKLYNDIRLQREQNNNEVTIDGNIVSDTIVATLNGYLNSNALTVKNTTVTRLGNIIYLNGSVDALFGKTNVSVNIQFDAEENDTTGETDIIFQLRTTLTESWMPGSSFSAIAGTVANQISLTDAKLVLASSEFWDEIAQKNIPAGLSFAGNYSPSVDFLPLKEILPANSNLSLSGTLTNTAGIFLMKISSIDTVDITLNLLNLQPLSLKTCSLYMETRYMSNLKLYKDKIRLTGTITVNGKTLTGTIQNASTTSQWELKIAYSVNPPSKDDLISLLNASSTFAFFPATIIGISDIDISDYGFTFNQLDHDRTGIYVRLDFQKVWDQLPVLNDIRNVSTNLTIERYKISDTAIQTGFRGVVTANTKIGQTPVDLAFYVGPPEDWALEIQPQGSFSFPSISDIANLIGGIDVKAQVPNNMDTSPRLTIKSLRASFNVKTPRLNYTSVNLGVEGTWYIVKDKLGINNLFIDLRVDDPVNSPTVTGSLGGNIEIGTDDPDTKVSIPVVAAKHAVNQGWTLNIAKNTQVPIPGIPSLLKLVGAEVQISYLPDALRTFDNFIISDIACRFAPADNKLQRFSFFTGQKDDKVKWQIIQDKLMIAKLRVSLTIDNPLESEQRSLYGFIGGELIIGKRRVPVLALKASPVSGWNIKIASDTTVKLPSLAEVFDAFDASDYFQNFPAAIRTFPSVYFKDVDILFKAGSADIEKFSFETGTTSKWTLLDSVKLVIGEVKAGLAIDYTKDPKAITGKIDGSVSIFKNSVAISAERKSVTEPWRLILKAGQKIHTPNGLTALAKWMAPAEMLVFIPDYLIPFKDGFDITDLNLNLNLSDSSLEQLSFAISNTSPWDIIKGHLSLDGLLIRSRITQFSPNLKLADVLIQGQLNIGDAGLIMKAQKTSPDALWNFGLNLANPVTLDFYKMLADVKVNSLFNISSLAPQSLTIDKFDVNLIPEIQYYKINGHGTLKWDIDLALTTLKINDLGGELEISEKALTATLLQERISGLSSTAADEIMTTLATNKFITAEGLPLSKVDASMPLNVDHEADVKQILTDLRSNKIYNAGIFGSFDFAGLHTSVSLKFGSEANTVLTATLTSAEVASLDTSAIATELASDDDNQTSAWSNLPVSSTFNDTTFKAGGFTSAALSIDFSNKLFVFFGQSATFGKAAFLARKLDKTVALWSFQGIDRTDPSQGQSAALSTSDSEIIWNILKRNGFINDKGEIQPSFDPSSSGFSLRLGETYQPEETSVIQAIQNIKDGDNWGYFIAVSTPDDGFKFGNIDSGLGIIDQYIHVRRASFAVSSFSANSVRALTNDVSGFDEAITIRKDGDAPVLIGKGVNFFAELDFSTDLLGNILKLDEGNDGAPAVTIYGYMASDVSETILQAQFPNITLLGGVHFTNVNFQYKVAKNTELSLCGTITIPIGDGLPFHGALKINDARADFKMQAGGDINPCSIGNTLDQPQIIRAPLGMKGINIQTPQLEVVALYKDESGRELDKTNITFSIAGGVFFKDSAGKDVLDVVGKVIFAGGTPVVVSVELKNEDNTDGVLHIGHFLNTIFGSDSWNFLDISFIGGGIYYAKCPDNAETCTFLDKAYKNGFTATTTIDIYGHKFGIEANVITTGEQQGITFSGWPATPIDLEFIKLYGVSDNGGTKIFNKAIGPIVGVSFLPDTKHFNLGFGLNLFQTDIGIAQLSYSTSDSKFLGDVTYTGPLSAGSGVRMKFTWSKEEGFVITDWPLQNMLDKDVLKLADVMKKISQSDGGCGELVDLAFNETINTNFSMSAKQKSGSCTTHDGKNALCFDVTGTYSIDILSHKNVVSASLPTITLTVPLPQSFSLSGLANLVKDTIVENAASIIKQFFSDPEKLTAFFALISVSNFSGKLLDRLMCRNVKSENIKNASETQAESEGAEGEEVLEDAETLAEEALAEGATAAEAGAAAAGAEVAADAAAGIFAVVIGLFSGLIALFSADYAQKKREAEEKKRRAEEAKRKAQEAMRNKLRISSIQISYQGAGTAQVAWNKIDGSGIDYDYRVLSGNDVVASQDHYNSNVVVVTNDKIASDAHISAQVRARVRGVYDSNKTFEYVGDWAENRIEILPKPVVMQQYSDHKLTASWPKITNAAGYYAEVFIINKNKVAAVRQNIPQSDDAEAKVVFSDDDYTVNDGGQYQVRVKAKGTSGFHDSEFGSASTFNIRLDAPSDVAQVYAKTGEASGITGSWTVNSQAVSYLARVATSNGDVIATATVTNDATQQRLLVRFKETDFSSLPPGGNLMVNVKAVGSADVIASGFSMSSTSTPVLAPPGNVVQQYIKDEQKLDVSWDMVTEEGFDHYSLDIYDERSSGNEPVFTIAVQPANPPVTPVRQRVDVNLFVTSSEALYRVHVRSMGGPLVIDSIAGISASGTSRLAAPLQVAQTYHNDTQNVDVEWDTTANAKQYQLQIRSVTGQQPVVTQLIEAERQQPARQSFTFEKDAFQDRLDGVYQAVAMALGDDNVINSEWGKSQAAAMPSLQVPALSLIYQDSNIEASWSNTDVRITEYVLQLFDGNGSKVGDEVSVSDHRKLFGITSPVDGTQYSVKMKVKAGEIESSWSEAAYITIHLLDKPEQLTVNNYGQVLFVTWLSVENAEGYSLGIRKADGTLLLPAIVSDTWWQVISSELLVSDQDYRIEVRARRGESFSTVNSVSYQLMDAVAATIYLPEYANGGNHYLSNNNVLIWDGASHDVITEEVLNPESESVTVKLSSGNIRTGWFPFVYRITNLSRASGFASGDRVVIEAFDRNISYVLVRRTEREATYAWELSTAELSDISQVYTINKWISTGEDGKPLFSSGSISDNDPVMLLSLLNGAPMTGGGPEGTVWRFQPPPDGRVVRLPVPMNLNMAYADSAEEIAITWENVTGNDGYSVDIFRVDNETVEYSGSTVSNKSSINIKRSDFTAAPGIFKGRARAKSTAVHDGDKTSPYDSNFSITAETLVKLGPAVMKSVVFENNRVTGVWESVENAEGYVFEIRNDTVERSIATSATTDSIEVSALPEGVYKARVKTKNVQNVISQGWSETLDVNIQPLDANALARKMAGEGRSVTETGDRIRSAFPDIDFITFAKALAQAPYSPADTAQALKKSFLALTSGQQATSLKAAYGELTPEIFATKAYAAGNDSVTAARGLSQNFPYLDYIAVAVALAKGGYDATQTASGLKAVFPDLTPAQQAEALKIAFGEQQTPQQYAQQAFREGKDPAATAQGLKDAFPSIDYMKVAEAMAQGGYTPVNTAKGLKAAFPALTPPQQVDALKAAYGEQGPEKFARQSASSDKNATVTAQKLMANFPYLDATSLAIALSRGGGYNAQDTAKGLKVAFPNLSPVKQVDALKAAFS